ncbi:hypothetical protein AALP_AAs58348U000100, partial [Arabis alpina]
TRCRSRLETLQICFPILSKVVDDIQKLKSNFLLRLTVDVE